MYNVPELVVTSYYNADGRVAWIGTGADLQVAEIRLCNAAVLPWRTKMNLAAAQAVDFMKP
jgi:hypothetical protein